MLAPVIDPKRKALLLVGVASICAVLALIGVRVFAAPQPMLLGASSLVGVWSAWKGRAASRAAGSQPLLLAASALLGYLGVVLLLVLGLAILVALRRGAPV